MLAVLRELRLNALHLAALSAFAVAQPLFDVLESEPAFFAARGSEGLEIVVFALAVTLVPPLVMVLIEAAASLIRPSLGRTVHLVFVATLCGAIAVQLVKRLDGAPEAVVLGAGVVLGVAAAVLYWSRQGVRSVLTVLSPAPILFVALFLFFSPVSDLTLQGEAQSSTARVTSRVPIVLVLLDEFPLTSLLDSNNRIDAARYPGFAALASQATWFRNATGVHDHTTRAIPPLLDGRMPIGSRRPTPTAADHPDNLFTLFGCSYSMNVVEHVTALCPRNVCKRRGRNASFMGRMSGLLSDSSVVYGHIALPDELARQLPSVSESYAGFGDDADAEGVEIDRADAGSPIADRDGRSAMLARAASPNRVERWEAMIRGRRGRIYGARGAELASWIAALRRTSRPSFYFHHALLPHGPFEYLPSGQRYLVKASDELTGLTGRYPRDGFLARHAYQRHMLQVAFTDRLLGALLRRLRQLGLYDEALVVVAADHGATFRGRTDRRYVNREVLEDIASVPLFVKAPGQRQGATSDVYVRTADVPATIADLLDVRLPWSADGRSGFSAAVAKRRSVVMRNRGGRPFRMRAAAFEREQAAALRRKLALFGEGNAGPGLYGSGPNRGLVGKRPSELGVRRGGGTRATIAHAGRLRSVKLGGGFLPALVQGRISGGGPAARRPLAFALNGRIVATGRSFSLRQEKGRLFAAMLPPSAFREGRNRLAVYGVEGARLRLLGGS